MTIGICGCSDNARRRENIGIARLRSVWMRTPVRSHLDPLLDSSLSAARVVVININKWNLILRSYLKYLYLNINDASVFGGAGQAHGVRSTWWSMEARVTAMTGQVLQPVECRGRAGAETGLLSICDKYTVSSCLRESKWENLLRSKYRKAA